MYIVYLNRVDFIDYFDKYYVRPYCRFGPYLVGMFTGYILYKTNCRCRINRVRTSIIEGKFKQ